MSAGAVQLSIVAPIYNEADIIEELIARCLLAGEQTKLPFECIFVDDHSQDESRKKLRACMDVRVRAVYLPENRGQFGATQAGIAAAKSDWIVVIDGDLQDPPELIPSLCAKMEGENYDVIFAVKEKRRERWWFYIGQWLFHRAQSLLGSGSRPAGAGSFCLMKRSIARSVTAISNSHLNLSTVVALQNPSWEAVSYEKYARYDGQSRVGFIGLCQEAIGSMAISGSLHRIFSLAMIVCILLYYFFADSSLLLSCIILLGGLSFVAFFYHFRLRRQLQRSIPEGE